MTSWRATSRIERRARIVPAPNRLDLAHKIRQQHERRTMTDQTMPQMLDPARLAPPEGRIDDSCAGIPLDAWTKGEPEAGVVKGVRAWVQNPAVAAMCYCHEPIGPVYSATDARQKAAGMAYVAEHHPELKPWFRTKTVPYNGVGSDCIVLFVQVDDRKPRKARP